MNEQLITFEVAKLAKEKGFAEVCSHAYSEYHGGVVRFLDLFEEYNGDHDGWCNTDTNISAGNYITAPTQSLLQKWLREVHNLHVNPYFEGEAGEKAIYSLFIHQGCDNRIKVKQSFPTYESALEQGLIETLKLIK